MLMGSIANFDLEMYPDIVEMLEGVSVGNVVRISGSFQVKEISDKRFSASFSGDDISITSEEEEYDEEEEDTEIEAAPETPESEEAYG